MKFSHVLIVVLVAGCAPAQDDSEAALDATSASEVSNAPKAFPPGAVFSAPEDLYGCDWAASFEMSGAFMERYLEAKFPAVEQPLEYNSTFDLYEGHATSQIDLVFPSSTGPIHADDDGVLHAGTVTFSVGLNVLADSGYAQGVVAVSAPLEVRMMTRGEIEEQAPDVASSSFVSPSCGSSNDDACSESCADVGKCSDLYLVIGDLMASADDVSLEWMYQNGQGTFATSLLGAADGILRSHIASLIQRNTALVQMPTATLPVLAGGTWSPMMFSMGSERQVIAVVQTTNAESCLSNAAPTALPGASADVPAIAFNMNPTVLHQSMLTFLTSAPSSGGLPVLDRVNALIRTNLEANGATVADDTQFVTEQDISLTDGTLAVPITIPSTEVSRDIEGYPVQATLSGAIDVGFQWAFNDQHQWLEVESQNEIALTREGCVTVHWGGVDYEYCSTDDCIGSDQWCLVDVYPALEMDNALDSAAEYLDTIVNDETAPIARQLELTFNAALIALRNSNLAVRPRVMRAGAGIQLIAEATPAGRSFEMEIYGAAHNVSGIAGTEPAPFFIPGGAENGEYLQVYGESLLGYGCQATGYGYELQLSDTQFVSTLPSDWTLLVERKGIQSVLDSSGACIGRRAMIRVAGVQMLEPPSTSGSHVWDWLSRWSDESTMTPVVDPSVAPSYETIVTTGIQPARGRLIQMTKSVKVKISPVSHCDVTPVFRWHPGIGNLGFSDAAYSLSNTALTTYSEGTGQWSMQTTTSGALECDGAVCVPMTTSIVPVLPGDGYSLTVSSLVMGPESLFEIETVGEDPLSYSFDGFCPPFVEEVIDESTSSISIRLPEWWRRTDAPRPEELRLSEALVQHVHITDPSPIARIFEGLNSTLYVTDPSLRARKVMIGRRQLPLRAIPGRHGLFAVDLFAAGQRQTGISFGRERAVVAQILDTRGRTTGSVMVEVYGRNEYQLARAPSVR